jgi:uncharacterized protein involved in exopolysaccharide biosynthesis
MSAPDVPSPEAADEEGLPLHLPTLALRLARLWWLALAVVAVAVVAGSALGLAVGSRVYQSTAILLYRPSKASSDTPSLLTLQSMVKLPDTLQRARAKAGVDASLEVVGASITADVQRSTDLLIIGCRWDDPKTAAALAGAVRDVFLEIQVERRRAKLELSKRDLEKRLADVSSGLAKAEKTLETFTIDNKVIDLDKEAQWYLEELTSLQLMLEQAEVKRTSVNLQAQSMQAIMADLQRKVTEEQARTGATMEDLGDINIKVQRLRDAINDDKSQRSGNALLTQKQLELDRASRLRQQGLISEAEFEKTRASYESQKALTVDTPDVAAMKSQIEDLNSKVIPKDSAAPSESAPILQEMMLKDFEITLQRVSQDEEVQRLVEARDRAKARLNNLPKLQQQHATLSRNVQSLEQEKATVEKELAEVKTALSSDLADFAVASEPSAPVQPVSSNRKLVAMATVVAISGAGLLGILLFVLLDSRLYSAADLKARLGLPALAGLGKDPDPKEYDFLALELRRGLVAPARLLLVSQQAGEGKTALAQGLSAALDRQGLRATMVVANEDLKGATSLRDAIARGKASGAVMASSLTPGECVDKGFEAVLKDAQENADYLLVEAPGAEGRIELELLLERCDAWLLVARSGGPSSAALKGLVGRLRKLKPPALGAVLTAVKPVFRRFGP